MHVLQADTEGLVGWVLDVVESLGALGVAALVLLETVVPPIPSEVVLPLAGFLVQQDRLSLPAVLLATTTASVLGALLLYGAGRGLGERRTRAILVRVPLVEHRDVDRAEEWFDRRGEVAVLVGRLVPGVRSLVSLPAGTRRMPVTRFVLLTALGSGIWNTLLVGAGMALGTQYRLVADYVDVVDRLLVAGAAVAIVVFVGHRLRRRGRVRDEDAPMP
ncbi:MAG TPA: DedA family protein [Jiangellales bacterium]|nr:DedA family protein [Jiangellales bacterium]